MTLIRKVLTVAVLPVFMFIALSSTCLAKPLANVGAELFFQKMRTVDNSVPDGITYAKLNFNETYNMYVSTCIYKEAMCHFALHPNPDGYLEHIMLDGSYVSEEDKECSTWAFVLTLRALGLTDGEIKHLQNYTSPQEITNQSVKYLTSIHSSKLYRTINVSIEEYNSGRIQLLIYSPD